MAEKIDPDDASWEEVKVAIIFTAATSAAFLSIFEIARRSPALSTVFDRRRNSKPHRTPPPLIRHSIFEWLFLSNEPRYSEYADLSHMKDVILECRRQRNFDHQAGFLSSLRGAKSSEGGRSASDHLSPQSSKDSLDEDGDRSMLVRVRDGTDGVETNIERAKPQVNFAMKRKRIQSYLTPDIAEVNGIRLPTEVAEYALANDLSPAQLKEYEDALIFQEMQDEEEFRRRVEGMRLRYERRGKRDPGRAEKDEEGQQSMEHQVTEVADEKVELPQRPNRLGYINFQQGFLSDQPTRPRKRPAKANSPSSIFGRLLSNRLIPSKSDEPSPGPKSPQHSAMNADQDDNVYVNRHLKTEYMNMRPLSQSDKEMLRCIGLDTFVMIRFLRFCFDCTFYPFILSCLVLIPTYYTNEWDGFGFTKNTTDQTEGYFRYTINRLEDSSSKIWVAFGFSTSMILFILRRHWIEWETFITLRFDFMANGDVENEELKEIEGGSFKSRKLSKEKDEVQQHLEQYRNSCLIEYVPESHRRDRELFQFFDAVFPNQVKRAEIIINASELAELVKQRQACIEKYESVYAKYQHAKQMYYKESKGVDTRRCSILYCLSCQCLAGGPRKPDEPTMGIGESRLFCCGQRRVKALPYLLSEINRLNRAVDKEHAAITKSKNLAEDKEEHRDVFGGAKNFFYGTSDELTCSTGFVEFTTLTAKQSALQCNLTGTNGYMVTLPAPDPRDMLWDNAAVERKFIQIKKMQCEGLLFTGTLFWSGLVSIVTLMADFDIIKDRFPPSLVPEDGTFLYFLVEGYLPVVLLELLMLPVPILLRIIATRFIRFKTHSEIDSFVYKWHFAYRVANLIIIVVRHQVLDTFNDFVANPLSTIYYLTGSITVSSQFFLNNMIIAAGTETLFELAQLHRIVAHFFLHQFIKVEAASRRSLDKLRAPISLEWGDVVPKFIFALLVAAVYRYVGNQISNCVFRHSIFH
jgi:hypothetical protein